MAKKNNKKVILLNNKYLLVAPFLLSLFYIIYIYNLNFRVNGSEYEFLFSEFIILSLLISFLLLIAYFILNKFIANKYLLVLDLVIFLFALKYGILVKLLFVVFLAFSLIYKSLNKYINAFLVFVTYISFLMPLMLVLYNGFFTFNNLVSFYIRLKNVDNYNSFVVDDTTESPNIYWLHMDGMPSISFINNYYGNGLEEFSEFLNSNDFITNNDASFHGGHHTLVSLNALFNPYYYDNYFGNYLNELDNCTIKNCLTKNVVSFKDVSYKKLDNEFFSAFKKKGYTTVGITEFNIYTALKTDYIYDVGDYLVENKKLPFFENKYNSDEIYKNVLNMHWNHLMNYLFDYSNNDNSFYQEFLDVDWNSDDYPLLSDTKFLPFKASLNAIEDVRKKDNSAKLYFIDSSIMHVYWNYDENGKFIRENNTDLNDFDDCYVYTTKLLEEYVNYIKQTDPSSVIVIQGDHGIHVMPSDELKDYFSTDDRGVLNIRNSTISSIYITSEFKNDDYIYLSNPLNISRYLVNNFVGKNYEYIKNNH